MPNTPKTSPLLPPSVKNAPEKKIAEKIISGIREKKSAHWHKERDKRSVELFHFVAQHVPAYRDFLKQHKVNPAKIKTFADFQTLPPVSKANYLKQYPLEKLCMDGSMVQSWVFTSTSGSTGKPFYFPRNQILDFQSSIYHQIFLENTGMKANKSTLVLVCFGMGVWIGGVITYEAFKTISEHGYPVTILTPGVNKKEIFEALKNLGLKYDKIVLCGYPPFLKDVIDEAEGQGIDWHAFPKVEIIFAAEAFSEKFRDYVVKKTGVKDPCRDIMNIYGSADLGTMATETPISILIRRLALKNHKAYEALFGEASRLPTLAQFNPDFMNFEAVDRSIYCTGNNALPLIRYEIGDHGGVLEYDQVVQILEGNGIRIKDEIKKAGIADTVCELPFVYVYERSDFSTKLYGAIIYPEYVKHALQHPSLEKYLTGKFTMYTEHDELQNEYLEVNIELKPKVEHSEALKKEARQLIEESLLSRSAEHKNNANMMPGRVIPRVVFWPHEHALHFQTGIKQKWVRKDPVETKKA